MSRRPPLRKYTSRPAAVSAELALLLPILALLMFIIVDFARLYYHYCIITNCARNGALYGSDPVAATESNYANLQAAALADAADLQNPQPTVSSTNGTDSSGNPYVEVTVTYPFQTISNYPGLSNPINLTRTVRMRVAASVPN